MTTRAPRCREIQAAVEAIDDSLEVGIDGLDGSAQHEMGFAFDRGHDTVLWRKPTIRGARVSGLVPGPGWPFCLIRSRLAARNRKTDTSEVCLSPDSDLSRRSALILTPAAERTDLWNLPARRWFYNVFSQKTRG